MDCPTEEGLLRKALEGMPGVKALDFNLMGRTLTVSHELADLASVTAAIGRLGMAPVLQSTTDPASSGTREFGAGISRGQWVRMVMAGVLALGAEALVFAGVPEASWPIILACLAAIGLGVETLKKGWIALKTRSLNMNLLMTVAVIGAALIGQWPEAAVVIWLFGIAEMIEALSLDRARNAIRKLMDLAPESALVRQPDGQWREVKADTVALEASCACVRGAHRAGRRSRRRPVVSEPGADHRREHAGGEDHGCHGVRRHHQRARHAGVPRHLAQGRDDAGPHRAVSPGGAGTARAHAALRGQVRQHLHARGVCGGTGRGDHSSARFRATLARMGLQGAGDAGHRLPLCARDLHAGHGRQRPGGRCAPGILVKGGLYLEQGRHLKSVALDKTGTLTHGRPALTDVIAQGAMTKDEALRLAASIDALGASVAAAIVAGHGNAPLSAVERFEALPGRGVKGNVNGSTYYVGNHRLIEELGICSPALEAQLDALELQAKTAVVLATDREVLAVLAVADTVRETSRQAVAELKSLGIEPVMLTGDNAKTALAVAGLVGIANAKGELLPQDKLQAIDAMLARGPVGMVGDGVNDAPALAKSSIGFAMGAAGTDTAIETADVALMQDDLRKLPEFIRLSQRVGAILTANIVFALGTKAVFMVLAFTGHASLWLAILADMGASLAVVFNGLRLLRAPTTGVVEKG